MPWLHIRADTHNISIYMTTRYHDIIYIITENILRNRKPYNLLISVVTSSHSLLKQDLFNPIIFVRAQMIRRDIYVVSDLIRPIYSRLINRLVNPLFSAAWRSAINVIIARSRRKISVSCAKNRNNNSSGS